MVKKGSKGCVIPQTTEYKCSENLELDKPYITKIESSSDGINEIENYRLIDEIIGDLNKDNRFFIGHPIVCNTDSNIKKELYLDITRDSDFYINLFKGLLNIFEAVKILNERKVYHFDIKPQNIVYDNSVMPPLLKLIDLGDSKYIPSPMDYKKEYNQIGTTGYFPPEKFGERGDSVFLLFVSGRGKEDSEILDYIRVNDEWLLNLTGETMSKAEYNKLKQENPEWYTKTDVWSLGATIFYILKQLEEDIDNDKYHNKNEFNYRTLFSKINMECIHALMRKMLMLDIEKRPDAGEAFQLYKDCLPKSQGGATKKRRLTKNKKTKNKNKNKKTKKRTNTKKRSNTKK